MKDKWCSLWSRAGAGGDPAPAFEDLRRRYSEPHRAYHTLEHIAHCLEEFEPSRSLARRPEAVELAIWYHDAVYDTRAKDNEERSAALFRRTFEKSSLAAELLRDVPGLILASRHTDVPHDPDARLFVDVDLSILGQPWEVFRDYEAKIRQEYAWVPQWIFRRKRRKILESFLQRREIYSTLHFRRRYERQARENLQKCVG